ncbi:MAG: hypothetical protein FJW14_12960 [Acidimicrobiia bacterium]|nr:hypothetical protein [Acidimicrobiia bacterium]
MEVGYRTPLLDFFRRGEVARDVRLLAAQGGLAPRAHEQLGLLMLLVDDQDPEIAGTAEGTLQSIPPASLSAFIARSDVSNQMREFFATRGIEPADVPAADTDQPMVEAAPEAPEGEGDAAQTDEEKHQNALQKIAALNVAQRVALAMKGSREERAILIRDPNKIVAVGVLSSPKMTDSEAESIAKMANVSDEILRIIAFTRAWVKNYGVVLALAKNPKTPVAVSMNLLSRLNEKDLRLLSTDRNVPDVLRVTARKKLVVDK